ncbi:MAG: hypothetical protein VCD00_19350, partial [Candidatus Hydrogenedentota bacterium]
MYQVQFLWQRNRIENMTTQMVLPLHWTFAVLGLTLLLTGCTEQSKPIDYDLAYISRTDAITRSREAIVHEIQANGGWASWVEATQSFRLDLKRYNQAKPTLPTKNRLIKGYEGFWVHPASVRGYSMPIVLRQESPRTIQESEAVVDSIIGFNTFLNELGIDLIFVPVPSRVDVYPEHFSTAAQRDIHPDPYTKAVMLRLLEEDIEVVDLYDELISAKKEAGEKLIYYRADPHPRSIAKDIIALEIASRLMRYPSVRNGYLGRPIYRTRQLPGPKILEYNIAPDDPDALSACTECGYTEILDEHGETLFAKDASRIIITGDSFVFAPLRRVNKQPAAGISLYSHIARAIRMKSAVICQQAGGPKAPLMVATSRDYSLEDRDVVVWIMSAYF